MKIKYYIINLDDNHERFLSAQIQLQNSNIQFERISAFDGRSLKINEFPLYNSQKAKNYMGRDLVGGEIGCYLSHIRCAEKFLESDADYAVILEDDFKINSSLEKTVTDSLEWLKNQESKPWHLINIGNEKLKIFKELKKFNDSKSQTSLCKAFYFPMTTTGLIWNREGAKAFLNEAHEIFAPVDNFFRYWLTRTNLGLAFDNPLVKTIGAESTIDDHKSTHKRKTKNRVLMYGLIKQRRLAIEKIIAFKNFLKESISARN